MKLIVNNKGIIIAIITKTVLEIVKIIYNY